MRFRFYFYLSAIFMLMSLGVGQVRAQTTEAIEMNVKGMVCSFCVNGLKKVLERQDAVAQATISLEKHRVRIFLKPGKTATSDEVMGWVKDAGFQAETFEILK